VQYARSDDGAKSFSAPVALGVAEASRAAHAQLALGDASNPEVVAAVWDDGTRKVSPIVARVSRDGGRTFGPTEVLSETGRSAGYPLAVLRGDTVTTVWQERTATAAQGDTMRHVPGEQHDAAAMIKPVGAWQVVTRSGVLARTAPTAAHDEGRFRPVAVGDTAPAYAARVILAGAVPAKDSVRIGSDQPLTLLNVWATWCTSCREEMADLNVLQRQYGPRGLRVVGVSVDQGDGARVARFASKEGLTFTVAHDPEGRIQESFQVVGVPSTYLIDAHGTVRWAHVGTLGDVMPRVRGALDTALALHRN
jgi:peroxiredoxin